ncbi:MAG: hypothetical protein KAJ12_06690, partial [Bacteroidetes bacterium]|nr:hypothetical protein [Bacteroidota bacterium]
TAGTRIFNSDGTPYPPFWFSGDPVAGTGDLPVDFPLGEFVPQDIRVMINTGPFTLAPGDTQEIVGALLHAQGSDRLNSVTLLKQVDRIAQQAFDDDFVVPNAPPLPVIKVSELSNEIIIDWQEGSQETESYAFVNQAYDYRFEGYNLYQGESTNGPWTRIGSWDLVNGITLIEDMIIDLEAGKAYLAPVQFGTDNGIQRFFIVDQDYVTGSRLVNYKEYFFALTTYAYSYVPNSIELGLRTALEFSKEPLTAVPKGAPVDAFVPTVTGEVLPHSRSQDDALVPEVIDPVVQLGTTYTIAVAGDSTVVTEWYLLRGSDTLATSTDFTGSVSSPLAEGVLMRLTNPVAGIRRDDQPDPSGYLYLPAASEWSAGASSGDTWADSSASYAAGDLGEIGGGQSMVSSEKLKKVEIRFGTSEASQAYRYIRGVPTFPPVPPRDSSFAQYILVKGPGSVYQGDFANVTVPFSAWEIDSLDGDPTPRRLNVGFLENNDSLFAEDGSFLGRGLIDAQWEPTTAENGALEVIFVFASTYADTES